jgi:hypothetical protein
MCHRSPNLLSFVVSRVVLSCSVFNYSPVFSDIDLQCKIHNSANLVRNLKNYSFGLLQNFNFVNKDIIFVVFNEEVK